MTFIEKLDNFIFDIWHELNNTQCPIILFGAGNKGKKALHLLRSRGVDVACFCDNNPELQSQMCQGKKVLNYDELQLEYKSYLLLITTTSSYAQEIRDQLLSNGEKNPVYHLTLPFKVDDVFLTRDEIVKNIADYERVYQRFDDDYSKELFLKFLAYKTSGNSLPLIEDESGDSFFDGNLIDREIEHHYVDVGAYTGDTVMKFCEFCKGAYHKIDAFELDKENHKKLQLFIKYSRLQNVYLHNIGLWHEEAVMPYYTLEGDFDEGFENPNLYADVSEKLDYDFKDEIANKQVRANTVTCKVNSIDNVLSGTTPTLIKINALASDLSVVEGCRNIARAHKPILVLDYGSRPSHILKIPMTIEQINPEYRLCLRQKSIFGDSKTVLYAI